MTTETRSQTAREILNEQGAPVVVFDHVKLAFDEAYNRPPTAKEQEIAAKSIAAETDKPEGLRLFIQAMFGANNFLYSY